MNPPKTTRIEDSPYPLVFKTAVKHPHVQTVDETNGILYRTQVRSLEGMQKEAVVTRAGADGLSWRLVCDEGPYLNGTDLAPFPLAFYTAGLAFSYMSQIHQYAKFFDVNLVSLQMVQDNYYSMNGSFLRGDARGGAQPVEVNVEVESGAPKEEIAKLLEMAEVSSPAHAAMRTALKNRFSLNVNGRDIPVADVAQAARAGLSDPRDILDSCHPHPEAPYLTDIITKVSQAEKLTGVEGGVASSLKSVQDRQLHVRGDCKGLHDGLKEAVVKLYKPIGSSFRFLSDEDSTSGGKGVAPSGLEYLSAGVAFCYMTQISRYAHIARLNIQSIAIIQDTSFRLEGNREDWSLQAGIDPVMTHVFIQADESDETARKVLAMGAQTCFLHAALSGSYRTKIQAWLNGEEISVRASQDDDS